MWGLFSKDPSKDFPYDIQEQTGQVIPSEIYFTKEKGVKYE